MNMTAPNRLFSSGTTPAMWACDPVQKDTQMSKTQTAASPPATASDGMATLRRQYGCGPVDFSGTENALYERHLLFDDVVHPVAAGPRERFEAAARSVRDILSQRWVLTEDVYTRANP